MVCNLQTTQICLQRGVVRLKKIRNIAHSAVHLLMSDIIFIFIILVMTVTAVWAPGGVKPGKLL
jgi:hypothetical protein